MRDTPPPRLVSDPDPAFQQALEVFLDRPSVAGWELLIQSVHPARRYQATRVAALKARARGVDPSLLFHCLLRQGPASELLGLVESGAVPPRVIAAAAQDAPKQLQALWWALAAQVAQERGEDGQAELMLHRALRADPDHPGVRVVLERMARKMEQPRREVA
jgi:hypothetical protein